MRRRTVEQWRLMVYRATDIPVSVKLYLVRLADHMRPDRTVSEPRAKLAAELGCHEQRIAERSAAAVKAGYLAVVSPGYLRHTAVYQGLFPEPVEELCVPENRTHNHPGNRYALHAPMCTGNRYTTSKQPPTGTAVGSVPNEKQQGRANRGGL